MRVGDTASGAAISSNSWRSRVYAMYEDGPSPGKGAVYTLPKFCQIIPYSDLRCSIPAPTETVPEGSKCPTYAAVSLKVNTERWKGVPCLITAGKGLSERTCTVEATLKPGLPYKSVLLRIQPDPGLWLIGPNGSEEIPFMEVRNPNRTAFLLLRTSSGSILLQSRFMIVLQFVQGGLPINTKC